MSKQSDGKGISIVRNRLGEIKSGANSQIGSSNFPLPGVCKEGRSEVHADGSQQNSDKSQSTSGLLTAGAANLSQSRQTGQHGSETQNESGQIPNDILEHRQRCGRE